MRTYLQDLFLDVFHAWTFEIFLKNLSFGNSLIMVVIISIMCFNYQGQESISNLDRSLKWHPPLLILARKFSVGLDIFDIEKPSFAAFLGFFRKRRRSSDTFVICLICGKLCCLSISFLCCLNVEVLLAIFLICFYALGIPIKLVQESLALHPNGICTLWFHEVNLQLLV